MLIKHLVLLSLPLTLSTILFIAFSLPLWTFPFYTVKFSFGMTCLCQNPLPAFPVAKESSDGLTKHSKPVLPGSTLSLSICPQGPFS